MFPLQNLFSIAWYFSAIRNTKWVGGMGRHSKTESFVQLLGIAEPALSAAAWVCSPLLPPTPLGAVRDYLGEQRPCKVLNSRLSGSFPGCCVKLCNCPPSLTSHTFQAAPLHRHPGAGGRTKNLPSEWTGDWKRKRIPFSDLTKEHKEPIGKCLTNAVLNSSQI